MLKALLRNPAVQFILGRLIGIYMQFVGWTTNWRRVNQAAVEPFWARPDTRLLCGVWHGRFFLTHKLWAFGPKRPKATFLISRSREGGLVVQAARQVGSDVVRGSAAKAKNGAQVQQKGGREATLEMISHLQRGGMVAITPDGPRGPRMRVKIGAVQVAKMAQTPLMGLAWSTTHRIVFDSWDRFVLPLPFGRGALVWSDPIDPPRPDAKREEMEAVRARFEAEMLRITAEADRLVGVETIEPAPAVNPAEREALAS
ncbi:MAG: lysophospholipid acyltransferase family protein [Hyphomonadaceae bacterium]|nr:lysophospholipid acyltransferase family protein [Hyphomonadaceae bacterium]